MVNKKELKEQAFIFTRKVFKNKKQIKKWMKDNNKKVPKNKKDPIRKYDEEYRCRQREPCIFNKRTLNKVWVCKGVFVIKGKFK